MDYAFGWGDSVHHFAALARASDNQFMGARDRGDAFAVPQFKEPAFTCLDAVGQYLVAGAADVDAIRLR